MRGFVTFTAAAALLAGIGMAQAQMSSGQSSGTPQAGESKMSQTGKFCSKGASGTQMDCRFATMAACEKEAKVKNETCVPNSSRGTTGSR